MATRYFVLTNPDIGRTYNWNTTLNWSTSSGGSGGASIPTADDDVFIDAGSVDSGFPINNLVRIDSNSCKCRNLHVSTGFNWKIIINSSCVLKVYGELNFLGVGGADDIEIFRDVVASPNFPTQQNFILLGTVGEVTHCQASYLSSVGGKRIYFNQDTCIVTNCPFWQEYNVETDPVTGDPIVTQGPITRHIKTQGDLQFMKDRPDDIYILDNSLDMTDYPWVPIGYEVASDFGGNANDKTIENPFTGSFDGKNHVISNLTFDDTPNDKGYAGMFASAGSATNPDGLMIRPTIQNISLSNVSMKGWINVAGLVGYSDGFNISNIRINNITLTGNTLHVTGHNIDFGGLIGYTNAWSNLDSLASNVRINNLNINGVKGCDSFGGLIGFTIVQDQAHELTITNCRVTNYNITATHVDGLIGNVGGLLGEGGGLISGCRVQGTISKGNDSDAGGFIGVTDNAHISSCRSEVIFTNIVDDANSIGGFVGYDDFDNTYSDCRADITLSTTAQDTNNIGGFVGYTSGSGEGNTYNKCFSVGNILISGTGGFDFAGFAGFVSGAVFTDCYSHVNVSVVNAEEVGGFAGGVSSDSVPSTVTNCYASGNVVGDNSVGGFLGALYDNQVVLLNCYSVGTATGSTNTGGFIGRFYTTGMQLENCSWYTASNANAIGDDSTSTPIATLASGGYGTDEPDNTLFYSKDHPVYAQV